MRKAAVSPVNPLLVAGATLLLYGGLFFLDKLAILDWTLFWHYWIALLVIIG